MSLLYLVSRSRSAPAGIAPVDRGLYTPLPYGDHQPWLDSLQRNGGSFVGKEPIISVSGLRGIVGDTLTEDVAFRYAAAFADVLPAGPALVTRDGRANGPLLLGPVLAGLSQGGARTVIDAGIAATPTTGVLVRQHCCAGGIQISASHNPAEYNGVKLFLGEGRVVPAGVGEQVLERYRTTKAAINPETLSSQVQLLEDTISAHAELVMGIVDVERIRGRHLRVVLDANHGSGSLLGKVLLERLGCDVHRVGGTPDGQFAHPPEPTAENLAGVLTTVRDTHASIGFCQDPDADRLAIIDENGRYIGEEYTLAICVDHVLRRTPGAVVTNCSTSRMIEDVARKHEVHFHRSAVGEANVVDMMLKFDAVIGGEGNGGVIDPRVGLVRDSFAGMALVLDAIAARELPVSSLADELPRYAICKSKLDLAADKVAAALDALEREYPAARHDRLDGLRLDWGNADGSGCWLLVRASNTEPIVRVIAEAPTADGAKALCDAAMRVMQTVDDS
jgi:phosphomannomutase